MGTTVGTHLTTSFIQDFVTNMQVIQEKAYLERNANLWFKKVAKELSSSSQTELLTWLLSSAVLENTGKVAGTVTYDQVSQVKQSFTNHFFRKGFMVDRHQLEDLDGVGIDLSSQWSEDIGAEIAYNPQREIAKTLLNGANLTAYDGVAFFHASGHLNHPLDSSKGTYGNLLTSTASGAYPGACPIDDSQTVDVAFSNLSKALAYINVVPKMPNGIDSRQLRVSAILHPPRMSSRVQQMTNAKFIAQAASSGGGSGDVEAIVRNWAFGEPIEIPEIAAGASYTVRNPDTGVESTVTGSDTTYYLLCTQAARSQLGALVFVNREPITITHFNGFDGKNVELARQDKLEWLASGRQGFGPGLPYYIFKCAGS